jgi:hypothetical protein
VKIGVSMNRTNHYTPLADMHARGGLTERQSSPARVRMRVQWSFLFGLLSPRSIGFAVSSDRPPFQHREVWADELD